MPLKRQEEIDRRLADLAIAAGVKSVALEENARVFNEQIGEIVDTSNEVLDNLKTIRNKNFGERFLDGLIGGPETSRIVQLRRLRQLQIRQGNAAILKQSSDQLANASVRSAATAVELELQRRKIEKENVAAKSAGILAERQRLALEQETVAKKVGDVPEKSLSAAIANPTKFNLKSADIPELQARLAAVRGTELSSKIKAEQLIASKTRNEAVDLQTRINDIDPKRMAAVIADPEGNGFEQKDLPELLLHKDQLDKLASAAVKQKQDITKAGRAIDFRKIQTDQATSDFAASQITDIKTLKALIANGQPSGNTFVNTLSGQLAVSTASLQARLVKMQKLQREKGARTSASRVLFVEYNTEVFSADTALQTALRIPGSENNPGLLQGRNELTQLTNDIKSGKIEVTKPVIARVRQLQKDAEEQTKLMLDGLSKEEKVITQQWAATNQVSLSAARNVSGKIFGRQPANSILASSAVDMQATIAAELAAGSGKVDITDFANIRLKSKEKDIVDSFPDAVLEPWRQAALIESSRHSWGLMFSLAHQQFPALGFDKFLSSAGDGRLAAKYDIAKPKTDIIEETIEFDTALIGQNIAVFAIEHEKAGDFDEGVDGLEFVSDLIKSILRNEEYQSKFAQLVSPKNAVDAALHQLLLSGGLVNRATSVGVIKILDDLKVLVVKAKAIEPIQRAKLGATNPGMNIFKALGLNKAAGNL